VNLLDKELWDNFLFLRENTVERFPIFGVAGRNNLVVSKTLLELLGVQLETLELLLGVKSLVTFSNRLDDTLSQSYVFEFFVIERSVLGFSSSVLFSWFTSSCLDFHFSWS